MKKKTHTLLQIQNGVKIKSKKYHTVTKKDQMKVIKATLKVRRTSIRQYKEQQTAEQKRGQKTGEQRQTGEKRETG